MCLPRIMVMNKPVGTEQMRLRKFMVNAAAWLLLVAVLLKAWVTNTLRLTPEFRLLAA